MSTTRTTPSAVGAAERERRAREVAAVRHSGEMEGLHLDPDTAADTAAYADGSISLTDLRHRIEARYPRA